MAIDSGDLIGGGGIAPPKAIHDKIGSNNAHLTLLDPNTDGSLLDTPTTVSGALVYRDAAFNSVWSYVPSDLQASADQWRFMYLDSVNQTLFVLIRDLTTTPDRNYLITIDIASGNIATLGSFQAAVFDTFAGMLHGVTRDTETSGDFTAISSNKVFVIDSTNGSLVSESALVIDGVTTTTISPSTGMLSPNGKYVVISVSGGSEVTGVVIDLKRVGNSSGVTSVPLPLSTIQSLAGSNPLQIHEWGNTIMFATMGYLVGNVRGVGIFDKADFFRYIDEYLGLT